MQNKFMKTGSKISSMFLFVVIWVGLVGISIKIQSAFFMVLAPALVLLFAMKFQLLPTKNSFRLGFLMYFLWLVKEVIMSSIAVSKIAWRRNLRIQPILEPVKSIQQSDIGLVTYANSITLTPGTVTLSLEEDILLVHALDVAFMDDLQAGHMDKKIKEVIK